MDSRKRVWRSIPPCIAPRFPGIATEQYRKARMTPSDLKSRSTFDVIKGSYLRWRCRSPTRRDPRRVGLSGRWRSARDANRVADGRFGLWNCSISAPSAVIQVDAVDRPQFGLSRHSIFACSLTNAIISNVRFLKY